LIGDGVYPVEGIRVKLIKDGQLITEALAAADGSYVLNEIVLPIGDDIDYFLAPQSYRDKESFYPGGHIPLKISANTPYQYILDDYTMPVTSCVHIIVKQAGKALSNAHGYLSIKRRLGSSGRAFMTSEDGDVYIPVGNDADVDITVSIDGFQDTVFKSETLIYRQTKELEIRL
jgi:hypothetical protein